MTKNSNTKIPVAIIGANGFTGIELTRLILEHPHAELISCTSRKHAEKKVSEVYPSFTHYKKLKFDRLSIPSLAKKIKAAFLCLPHHESMEIAAKLRKKGIRVIDLSADFRLNNLKVYEKFYGKHTQAKLAKTAIYGLCEIYKESIKSANLIAAPGCYVTSILLALAPFIQNQMIKTEDIICDSKSGTSGAGRKASESLNFSLVNENFSAYGIASHRHRPEIEEKLSQLSKDKVKITFTPHLLPITRGILSTIYVKPHRKFSSSKFIQTMQNFYKSSPFVEILPAGCLPQIKNVVGTNRCQISATYDPHSELLILVSVIDNLLKGASGQAIQCFNLMFGFEETSGLTKIALQP